jgi:hypothetical protein
MGENINEFKTLVGKPEGRIPVGRPKRGVEENIKMDLRQDGTVWTGSILVGAGFSNCILYTWC